MINNATAGFFLCVIFCVCIRGWVDLNVRSDWTKVELKIKRLYFFLFKRRLINVSLHYFPCLFNTFLWLCLKLNYMFNCKICICLFKGSFFIFICPFEPAIMWINCYISRKQYKGVSWSCQVWFRIVFKILILDRLYYISTLFSNYYNVVALYLWLFFFLTNKSFDVPIKGQRWLTRSVSLFVTWGFENFPLHLLVPAGCLHIRK